VKVLLDECLPRDLRKCLVGHECGTVAEAGFAGKANGELMALAEQAGWQVLLTIDRGMPYQQNLMGRTIALAIVRSRSNRMSDLLYHVPEILNVLRSIGPGEAAQIG
jgi:hypothetical protein